MGWNRKGRAIFVLRVANDPPKKSAWSKTTLCDGKRCDDQDQEEDYDEDDKYDDNNHDTDSAGGGSTCNEYMHSDIFWLQQSPLS